MKRLCAGVAGVVLALLAAVPAANARVRFERCGSGFRCATVHVPLDRAGALPGRIALQVRRVRALRRPGRRALFVLAGGPGQSATAAFGHSLFPLDPAYRRRDLILFDQRGTGRSGLLRCRRLERANLLDAGREAARCAARLGARRAFYTTPDTVEDIEAIRVALGYRRIALFGTSYGTKVALAYALAHPGNVERLVLDSVVEADGPDALYLDSVEAVPRVLTSLCRTVCRRFTPDPVAEVQALVARMAAGPVTGRVYDRRGRGRVVELTRGEVLSTLVSGDFDPAFRADFPAAVHSALNEDPAPLIRLQRRSSALESQSPGLGPREFSTATYAATTCEEARLPWERTAPSDQRRAQAAAYAEGVPPEAFSPFDRPTAVDNDIINLCELWPAAPTAPAFGSGPLPDVPVLVLQGEDDLRTPVESARRVAALFPRSRLYVASATGHSALGSDFSGCTERAFVRFLLGRRLPGPCRRVRRRPRPSRPLPAALRDVGPAPGLPGRRGRVVRAVLLTLDDVAESYEFAYSTSFLDSFVTRGAGLRGGRWEVDFDGDVRLRGVRLVPGVRVSGRVRRFLGSRPRGRLRVRGRATPDGVLALRGRRLTGRLGGRLIRGRLASGGAAAARTPELPDYRQPHRRTSRPFPVLR